MKIAFLHLNLGAGPTEKNRKKLCCAIEQAAKNGAKWILTPEMALQGYFMVRGQAPYKITRMPGQNSRAFQELARRYKVTIFLGCGERDAEDDLDYNSCLVINEDGKISGRHRKIKVVRWVTEAWSTAGTQLITIRCADIQTGVLVCADAWFEHHAAELGKQGAQIIVVVAAWPPGCGGPPENAWMRSSNSCGGVPVLVCNQTGTNYGMDCTVAQSAVVINGKVMTSYAGEAEKILITEIRLQGKDSQCTDFELMDVEW